MRSQRPVTRTSYLTAILLQSGRPFPPDSRDQSTRRADVEDAVVNYLKTIARDASGIARVCGWPVAARGAQPASMDRYLLVMTACVDPSKGEYRLNRADPAVRLADYETALRFWLQFPDPRIRNILLIENSNYPLDRLEAIAAQENPLGKRVEFISLDCNWYPPGGHYGYAELRMLDLGLQQSRLRGLTTHMIKVSGRFKFPSLTRLLDRLPAQFDAVADARAWRGLRQRLEHPYVTTPIILFAHDFYKEYLQDCYRELESGNVSHMEAIYYRRLMELAPAHRVFFRFPCNASPIGFPAHRSRSYTHPTQIIAHGVRAIARRIVPDWWI
jgi:hypothetical protein